MILRQQRELAEQRRVIAEREARVEELGERVRTLENEVARLSQLPKSEARRLQKRYQQHRDRLYVFLERDDVEPTNSSERDLRNSVIHRKVTGGYRSAWGAKASAVCTSILTTARKRGQHTFEALCALAGASPLRAAGLPT